MTSAKDLDTWTNALQIAESKDDKDQIAKICNRIGRAYADLGQLGLALKFHKRDLKCCEELGNAAGQAISHQNLGDCYLQLRDFQKSDTHYHAFLNLTTISHQRSIDRVRAMISLGNLNREEAEHLLNHPEEANKKKIPDNLQKALGFYRDALSSIPLVTFKRVEERYCIEGSVHSNMGLVYDALDQYELAVKENGAALLLFTKANDDEGIARCYGFGGSYRIRRGLNKEGIEMLKKGLEVARKCKSYTLEMNAYNAIGDAYYKCRQFHRALEFFETSLQFMKRRFRSDTEGIKEVEANLMTAKRAVRLIAKATETCKKPNPTIEELSRVAVTYFELDCNADCVQICKKLLGYSRAQQNKMEEARALIYTGCCEEQESMIKRGLEILDEYGNRLAIQHSGAVVPKKEESAMMWLRVCGWEGIVKIITDDPKREGRKEQRDAAQRELEKFRTIWEAVQGDDDEDDDLDDDDMDMDMDDLNDAAIASGPEEHVPTDAKRSRAAESDKPTSSFPTGSRNAVGRLIDDDDEEEDSNPDLVFLDQSSDVEAVEANRTSYKVRKPTVSRLSDVDSDSDVGFGIDDDDSNVRMQDVNNQPARLGNGFDGTEIRSQRVHALPVSSSVMVSLSPTMSLFLSLPSSRGPITVSALVDKVCQYSQEEFGLVPAIRSLSFNGSVLPHSSTYVYGTTPLSAEVDFFTPVDVQTRFTSLCSLRNLAVPSPPVVLQAPYLRIAAQAVPFTDFHVAALIEAHAHVMASVKIVDLSRNPALTNVTPALFARTPNLQNLQEFHMSMTRIGFQGVSSLVRFLERSSLSTLQRLDFSGCSLSGISFSIFTRFPSLLCLNMSFCSISVLDCFPIAEEILLECNTISAMPSASGPSSLYHKCRKLSLRNNRLRQADLIRLFSTYASLEELDLSSNCITGLDGVDDLEHTSRLGVLDISNNPISAAGMQHLLTVLGHSQMYLPSLSRLNLDSCSIPWRVCLQTIQAVCQRSNLISGPRPSALRNISLCSNFKHEESMSDEVRMHVDHLSKSARGTEVDIILSDNGIPPELTQSSRGRRLRIHATAPDSS
eukprot:ANDGO_00300.mRNA.1 Tonsoku-like protein OS=Danio rerio GN=tonsl PE=2 SV=1